MIHQFVHRLCLHFFALKRDPDVYIGGKEDTYMKRWWVIPRNPVFNIYFHEFMRSDNDVLHDHPWWNASWILAGSYKEIVPDVPKGVQPRQGTPTKTLVRKEGYFGFRLGKSAHRVELYPHPTEDRNLYVNTLFFTGPRFRKWGFWCPHSWRFWEDFNNGVYVAGRKTNHGGGTSRGCE